MIDQQVMEALTECQEKITTLTGKKVLVTYLPATHTAIRTIICNEFNVEWHHVMGSERKGDYVKARHVYWWFQKMWYKKKIPTLAIQHHVDVSTIKHAINKLNDILTDGSDELCDAIERIGTQLKTFSN